MTAKKDLKKRIRNRQVKTGESYTTARAHILRARGIESSGQTPPIELVTGVVLKCNESSVRIRIPGKEDETFTLRTSHWEARRIAPGQFIEVELSKQWLWRDDAYASGTIKRTWTDIPAIGLAPLPLEYQGMCTVAEISEPFRRPDPYAEMWEFLASVPRRQYRFDPIAWGAGVGVDPNDDEACLVTDAADISPYDPAKARTLLMAALLADLRCIDAHAHLGNLVFNLRPQDALVHYEIAIAIGELSMGPDFNDLLPWGPIYNRPFLRALHGYGLCLWRLGRDEEAQRIFERILALNPNDNQGVRFCLDDIRNGRPWRSDDHVDSSVDSMEAMN